MALSDNKEVKRQDGKILAYDVADNEDIYKGAAVVVNDSGKLEAGTDAADKTFVGVAVESNSEQVLGEEKEKGYVRVFKDGVFEFEIDDDADPSVGDVVYLVDDETVSNLEDGETDGVDEDIEVGNVVEVSGSTARVRIDNKVN